MFLNYLFFILFFSLGKLNLEQSCNKIYSINQGLNFLNEIWNFLDFFNISYIFYHRAIPNTQTKRKIEIIEYI